MGGAGLTGRGRGMLMSMGRSTPFAPPSGGVGLAMAGRIAAMAVRGIVHFISAAEKRKVR